MSRFLLVLAVGAALAAPCAHAAERREVLRVHYADAAALDAIGGHFGHVDVDRKNHVARVDVDAEGRAWLVAQGLTVEVDRVASDALARTASIGGFACYRTVEETQATADALVAAHPNLASVVDVGDSWSKTQNAALGYDLRVLRIDNASVPGPKPTLFVMSGLHAREYTPVELTTRFAEWLLGQYGVDPTATWLVDHYAFHFLLQSNPDGRKQAETGLSWRKNTNTAYCGAASNSRGADLNRNFGLFWGTVPGGSSGNACDDTYRGPLAASEPEIQAIQNYLATVFPDTRPGASTDLTQHADPATQGLFFDLHSYSRLVLWPWGTSRTQFAPEAAQLTTLGRRLAAINGYTPEQASQLYLTDGTSDDFAYGTLGVPAFTIELGSAFFEDCGTFENDTFPKNFATLKYAARVLAAPYRWPGGPDARDLSATPSIALATDPIQIRAQLDDTRFNQSNGTEPVQAIAGGRVFVDAAPTPAGGGQPMSARDGAFDATSESAAATLAPGSLALGRHLVYVQGSDASGAVGAPDAVWVEVLDAAQVAGLNGHLRDVRTSAPLAASVRTAEAAVTAGADGAYDLPRLRAGAHTIVASAPGYLDESVSLDLPGGSVQSRDIALVPECRHFADDSEGANPGWTATAPWGVVTLTGPAGTSTKAWTDSPGGNYADNSNRALTSPVVNLAGIDGVRLVLDQKCDTEAGWDFGRIEVSTNGGTSWTEVSKCSGDPQWRRLALDLPALDGAANARIRFRFTSDTNTVADGWTIDNIVVAGTGAACRASQTQGPLLIDGFE